MRRLLAVLLLPLLALAATYYVAKNGNDGNPGTAAQPWLTVGHCTDRVHAGDTVFVHQGTYSETLNFNGNDGTAAHPIVIASADGLNTIISGAIAMNVKHYIVQDFKMRFVTGANDQFIKFFEDSCAIRRCDISPVDSNADVNGIFIAHTYGVIVDSNTIHAFGIDTLYNHDHGIYAAPYGGCKVRWNSVSHIGGSAIQQYFEGSEPPTNGTEFAFNLVHDNPNHAAILFKGDSNWVHDNITYNNETGIFIYYGGSANARLYNNTSYNDYEGFYDGANGPNVFRNNNVIGKASSILVTSLNNTDSIDYNCYFPDGATKFTYYTSGGTVEHDVNFAGWKAGTGQDAHSICTNPLVTDTAGHNFHLTASSPCIDKGWPSTPSSHDFDGLAYSGSSTDLGALQYEAGTSDSLDAGVLTIFTPSGTVDSGVVVKCSTTVHNYGTKTISPTVKLTVSTYKDSATVTNLTAGSSAVVNFTNWTPLVCGTFAVTCSTRLANDQNTANDKATGSVIVASVAPPASSGKSHYPLTRKSGAVKANVGKVK